MSDENTTSTTDTFFLKKRWVILEIKDERRFLFGQRTIHSCHKRYFSLMRRYDMNGRFPMQGGKNWILQKDINANRFF
jgi:hypothetical protein